MPSVEKFIFNLPREEQQIVKRLRMLLLDIEPRFEERLSYGVPYFYRHRRICFLWPASAPLGPKDCLVQFGFCYGNLLSNEQGLMAFDGRKQVSLIRISSLAGIHDEPLREIIQEAVMVDDLKFKKNKKKK